MPTGKVVAQCASREEIKRVHAIAHGKQIKASGHEAAIRVQSNFVDLPL